MDKILVIDDEPEICKILDTFLTKHGFQVTKAAGGEEGLSLIEKENFDLLIQDKRMPGINALGILSELKKRKNDIPVIVLTGSLEMEKAALDEIKKLGYHDFLYKPIDLEVLLERVKKRLGIVV